MLHPNLNKEVLFGSVAVGVGFVTGYLFGKKKVPRMSISKSHTAGQNNPLMQYVLNHSLREHPVLKKLRLVSRRCVCALSHRRQILISEQEASGADFHFWVSENDGRSSKHHDGAYTGYNTLNVALALPEDSVVACDISEEFTNIAKPFWKEAGVEPKIDLRIQPALKTLADEEVVLKGQGFGPCIATLRPERACSPGQHDATCPYLLHLPPLTVNLPPQFQELEKIMQDLQKLKESVDELREMCANCTVSQTGGECGRQSGEREKMTAGKGTREDERNWVRVIFEENDGDFREECGKEKKTEKTHEDNTDDRLIREGMKDRKSEPDKISDKKEIKEKETIKEDTRIYDADLSEEEKYTQKYTKTKETDGINVSVNQENWEETFGDGVKVNKNNEKPEQTELTENEKTIKEMGLDEKSRKIGKEIKTESGNGDEDGELSSSKTTERADFVSISPTPQIKMRTASRADSMDSRKVRTFTSSLPLPPFPSFTLSSITDVSQSTAAGHGPTQSTGPNTAGVPGPRSFDADLTTDRSTTTTVGGPGLKTIPNLASTGKLEGQLQGIFSTSTTTPTIINWKLYMTTSPRAEDDNNWKPKSPGKRPQPGRELHPGKKYPLGTKPEANINLKKPPNKPDKAQLPIKKSQPHQKEKPSLQKPKANKPKPNRDSTQTKNVKPVQKRFPDISKPDKTRKNSSLDTHKQGQPPDQNKTSSQSLIFTLKFPPAVLKPTTHRPQVVNTTLSDTFSSNNSAFTPKQHENNQIKSIMKYNENPLPESDSNSESKHEEKDSITPDQDVESNTIQKPDPAVQPEPKLEIKSGTNPTQSSWTSSTIQTMSTTMQPTLGIVKKLAEETPSPLDNNPNASFKKTITEQPNNRINSTEMSKENFLPEPKSNPYTTSEEKRSQLVTSTAVWEIKPTQKTSTVHQNPKMIKEVESAAGPTSTPKPLEGLREVSGDNRPYEPKPTSEPPSETNKSLNPAVQPQPKQMNKTGTDPTPISWTSSVAFQNSNTNTSPRSSPVKQISEMTQSPWDSKSSVSIRKTITEGTRHPITSVKNLAKNLFSEPNSSPDSTSEENISELVNTTPYWETTFGQEISKVHQNPTTKTELESTTVLTTTTKPLGEGMDKSDDNTTLKPKSKTESLPKPPTRPTLEPPAETIQKLDPAVQPDPKLKIKSGAAPTQSSWTSTKIQTMSTTMQSTLGFVKKLAEETPSPLDNNPNVSFKKTITEQPKNLITSTEMSNENLLPEPNSNPYTTSEEKRSQLLTSTAHWDIKPTQKTSTVHQNPKISKKWEFGASPITTPKPLEESREVSDTIQNPDPAVQPDPKLEIKSGTNPTQSSWTSSTTQTMSTTTQPTLGIVKKMAEETPSPLDNKPNVSFRKTITEQPNNRINSTEMSKENFLPEPKSNPYTTSEEKRSQLVTSTAVWEIKPTQKTSTVHQNPKMIKEVESAAGPTSTPKPLEGLREVSGDNRPYEPKSKEESEPKLTPTLVQTTAWPTKRPTLRGNISKTNQTAKLGQAPKQKPKFQKPGTGLNTKTLIKFKPGQPPKTNPKLKPPGPGQKPPPGFTPFGDKFFKAQSNKTNLRPPYRSKPPPRPTLEPQSETNKRFNPAVQPQPKQVNKKVTDPTPISWISSVPFQNTNTNKPLTSGPVQQISEMTQSPWGSKNNLQNENFPSSPSNRIIISDMKPQKNNQAPVMPMTTKPNKVDSEIPQNIISSTIPGSTLSSGLPKYDSTSKMPHNVEKSPPATIVPSPSSKTTSTMHPDFRSASPTTPGLDPQTSADSAQELREKKDQVAAFPNNSQSPNRSPADEHPKQHPKATDGDETNKISTETTLTARRDCSDLLLLGEKQSGVYTVTPDPRSRSFSVFCDMELEGGGWTVLQRRLDGSVSFNRTWAEYRSGFGVLDGGEFWLGNNMIHLLTRDRNMVLRVELEDFNGIREHAQYQYFRVASEKLLYKLMVGGYSGTAGDALRFSRMYNHNNRAFTTPDKDNDRYPSGNCGAYYSSGWWFDACMAVNLNGKYYVGPYKGVRNGIFWGTWHNISREYYPNNERHSFKTVRMMTRPARFKP
ncbi:Fibroleukin [Oryzias melastigma]|uniref:Fibroleukin n=1 Tax=Oryzias melastigma TaxID=30732 RepID=A0A834FK46_ORYME|nr:Fibroleukin [Oryzias melastigma]